MEQTRFEFTKWTIWPSKTALEVGPMGINYNGELTPWPKMDPGFSYNVKVVNGSKNYVFSFIDEDHKKGRSINSFVTILGSRTRKKMLASVYDALIEGFLEYVTEPLANDAIAKIDQGESVTLQGTTVSKQGVTVPFKKEQVLIPNDDVELSVNQRFGGFFITSKSNKKHTSAIGFLGREGYRLLTVLNKRYPDRAISPR